MIRSFGRILGFWIKISQIRQVRKFAIVIIAVADHPETTRSPVCFHKQAIRCVISKTIYETLPG
jgi:hypothetical protein